MKTKCQWCEQEVNASPELIARAQAGEVILICWMCKSLRDQYREEAEEYERMYAAEHARLKAQHAGMAP